MKRHSYIPPILFVFTIFILSCSSSYQSQSLAYKNYRVTPQGKEDPSLQEVIKPYSDSVNKSMNDVVGVAEKSLEKKTLESTLGNFMVDAFFIMAKEKYNVQVDGAIMNYGGIRLTQLPAGNVTRGKVFELMPFDNLLILQKMKGDVLQQLLDLTAAMGGWPVAGLSMQIKDKKAVNVLIGGKALDPQKIYTIANSDFLANGGDNADMLRPIAQITNGYLMRDALFDYIKWLKSQGKNIIANEEKRVSNAQ
ncbi:MAG TPA: 5'-nucleotidase C-terminal domain-containing protein [Chitinophagaceae bacterium]|nr:5'-nucleotidase C-terminal domain-containing protein [Chitinophagaceae bacterium]